MGLRMEEIQTIDLSQVLASPIKPRRKRKSDGLPPLPSSPGEVVVSEPSVAASPEQFLPLVPALYRVLGSLEALIAHKVTGQPFEVAQRCFEYSPPELAILEAPTAAVLAKHAPKIASFSSELTLALLLMQVNLDKVRRFKEALHEAERADIRAQAPGEEHISSSHSVIAQ